MPVVDAYRSNWPSTRRWSAVPASLASFSLVVGLRCPWHTSSVMSSKGMADTQDAPDHHHCTLLDRYLDGRVSGSLRHRRNSVLRWKTRPCGSRSI